jgi:hypothetical protein
MSWYLPHIINCSLVGLGGGINVRIPPYIINNSLLVGLLCTLLSRWYTALDTKEVAR